MRSKRLFALACVALLCYGCETIDNSSALALKSSFNVISTDYLEYVEADATLNPEDKEARRAHVAEHTALLEDLSK